MFECSECEKKSRTIQGLASHVRTTHKRMLLPVEREDRWLEETPEKKKRKRSRRKTKVVPAVAQENETTTSTYTLTQTPTLNYCPNCGCCLKGVKDSIEEK